MDLASISSCRLALLPLPSLQKSFVSAPPVVVILNCVCEVTVESGWVIPNRGCEVPVGKPRRVPSLLWQLSFSTVSAKSQLRVAG